MIIYGKNTRFNIYDVETIEGKSYLRITDGKGRELRTNHIDNTKCEETMGIYRLMTSFC